MVAKVLEAVSRYNELREQAEAPCAAVEAAAAVQRTLEQQSIEAARVAAELEARAVAEAAARAAAIAEAAAAAQAAQVS